MKAIIYEIATGLILKSTDCPSGMVAAQAESPENAFLITSESIDDSVNYVTQGEILPRPIQSITLSSAYLAADGVDTVTLTGAPPGAILTITHTATGETVSGVISDPDAFVTTLTGLFKLTVTCWPYLDYGVNINAL